MKGRARPIYPPNNAPPTPPSENPAIESGLGTTFAADGEAVRAQFNEFTKEDEEILIEHAEEILGVPKERLMAAWTMWATEADVGEYSMVSSRLQY